MWIITSVVVVFSKRICHIVDIISYYYWLYWFLRPLFLTSLIIALRWLIFFVTGVKLICC